MPDFWGFPTPEDEDGGPPPSGAEIWTAIGVLVVVLGGVLIVTIRSGG